VDKDPCLLELLDSGTSVYESKYEEVSEIKYIKNKERQQKS
jgi:hypothetical protein